jgi:16S rRNA (cytidine1402-2'-O)-methyltransferase
VTGKLILCGTPIGNLEDISHRALRVLQEADIVACEDTRRTGKLLAHYSLKARRLVSYHEANERKQARYLVERIDRGDTVVVVSDAGMPGLSDPGYRIVRACIEAGVDIEVVPGPSAAIAALTVSGLPPGRFLFEGFLPRKTNERQKRIADLASEPRTIVLYESPYRLADCLADLHEGLGDRPAAIARELTKIHEEVRRGTLSDLLHWAQGHEPRGEFVIVVEGAVHAHRLEVPKEELARRARDLMDAGVQRREALARVARDADVARRRVFDALVEDRERSSDQGG